MNHLDAPPGSPLLGTRILVVDDAIDERALLASYLHLLGCRVYLASDGLDAVQKAIVVRPDIILMDMNMPVCDGLTACRLLQENAATHGIPVIFLSVAATPAKRVAGLRVGAVDYITKPFDFEEVKLRLNIHLRENPPPLPPPEAKTSSAQPLDQILFITARQYLLANTAETVDMATLAKKLCCNPRRLNEAFKNCAGMTVSEFLREQRMKQAQHLLSATLLDVQAIANEIGFTSGANFATAFKERFGLSPTEFRRSARQTQTAATP